MQLYYSLLHLETSKSPHITPGLWALIHKPTLQISWYINHFIQNFGLVISSLEHLRCVFIGLVTIKENKRRVWGEFAFLSRLLPHIDSLYVFEKDRNSLIFCQRVLEGFGNPIHVTGILSNYIFPNFTILLSLNVLT